MDIKLKFSLSEEEKEQFRNRLEEVLSQTEGNQIIILWDKNKFTDYYQNICGEHLLEKVEEMARDYAELTQGKLIYFENAKS